jgi:hypothetical protein
MGICNNQQQLGGHLVLQPHLDGTFNFARPRSDSKWTSSNILSCGLLTIHAL